MTNTSIYTVTLESADTWAFAAGNTTITFNCLEMPRKPKVETQVRYAGGGGRNKWDNEFHLAIYPFSTVASSTDQDSADLDLLITFLESNKPMRIKSSTLPRYKAGGTEEIPTRRAYVENCPVFVTSFDVNLESEQAEETCSLVLERVQR